MAAMAAREKAKFEAMAAQFDPNSEEAIMLRMGIPMTFDSTHGKHVEGADMSAVKVVKKHQYRQYMNRHSGPAKLSADTGKPQ